MRNARKGEVSWRLVLLILVLIGILIGVLILAGAKARIMETLDTIGRMM